MSAIIIPLLIIALLIYARIKKVAIYDNFCVGAKKGLNLVYEIFPYIASIIVAVWVFRESGLTNSLCYILSPVFSAIGIPSEVCELVLLKPLSGNGSFAILESIYQTYGVDSYASRCASVIMGSSETIFYISAVYFSKTKVRKCGIAILISLFCSIVGAIVGCLLCKVM